MSKYTLNGLEQDNPPGAEYRITQVPRKPYLQSVRARLTGDVGFLIGCLEQRNREEPRVGFFTMVRAIMPIIETVADSEGRTPQELLADLGFGAPYLTWNLYRNVFLHGDEFVLAAVDDTAVQSGIVFTTAADEEIAKKLAKDGLMFDPFFAYRRLLEHVEARIAITDDDALVDVIKAIHFDPETRNRKVRRVVDEVRVIHNATRQPGGGPQVPSEPT